MERRRRGEGIERPYQHGWNAFQLDAARWVRPEQVADVSELSLAVIAKMLVRHPPLRAMAWFRFGSALRHARVRAVPAWVQRRLLRLYGLELEVGGNIGGGLYIAHPVGCVIVAEEMGDNVTIISQVTFGTRGDRRWPRVGDAVFVGAGARLLGGIHIGSGAQVGANAVVVHDVRDGATVVGVPARELPRSSDV